MADCVLFADIMTCILTRLPVKSILRFMSVCKPWLEYLSSPEFRNLHQARFSSDPKNHSFIIHRRQWTGQKVQFSIFNFERGPTILHQPLAYTQNVNFDTIGCCNGLLCISCGQVIILLNPAMKLSKIVSPLKDRETDEIVSLGLGFDAVATDFKVVRIVGWKRRIISIASVEMYSVNSDSWITIDVGFQFSVFRTKCDLIVNGNPYWNAQVDGVEVFVYFDVIELVFKIVPALILDYDEVLEEEGYKRDYLDLDGYFGVLSYYVVNERIEYLNIWVFDDVQQVWIIYRSFGAIELDPFCFWLSWGKGKILGSTNDSKKLFVFDFETGGVKVVFEELHFYSEVYGYTESLAGYIKGMEKVEVIDGGCASGNLGRFEVLSANVSRNYLYFC